ncbi:hypothetical protein GRI55_09560 [Erythrobacter citreus]|uniref:Uncharacterized protein n=1 Tax=Qipengyuania citrea TaxID=225971 RepID=A0A6I4UFC7_9SPHN|nr:hypothetical protein [Qipengyuania citrea]MDQ0564965.1 hypothetical protein [Qipengyuania citrea]MXP36019.1 hypothetical protein [Qipengyuania citrea]
MSKPTPKLHTLAINVRAAEDTYSAMPVRVLKAVAELEGIPIITATTAEGAAYLRLVEGEDVRVIVPERINGLMKRIGNSCDVIVVDVPVVGKDLVPTGELVDRLRSEARDSELEYRVFMTRDGALSRRFGSLHRDVILGAGLVLRVAEKRFDPLGRYWETRPKFLEIQRRDALEEPGRSLLSYRDAKEPDPDTLAIWMNGELSDARTSNFIRSILDGPSAC